MGMIELGDDDLPEEQVLFCPNCNLPLYPKDEKDKYLLFSCRACCYEDQLDYEFSWETLKVNNNSILPPVKTQSGGTCVPTAMITAIESRLKYVHATENKSFTKQLSVHHLVGQYESNMRRKYEEGADEGKQRMRLCRRIMKEKGVCIDEYLAKRSKKRKRYKADHVRKKGATFSYISRYIAKGYALFTVIPVTDQFDELGPEDMYIADANEVLFCKNGVYKEWHGITLVGFGRKGKVDYFRFQNSYGPEYGKDGFGYVRAKEITDVTHFKPF